MKAAVREKMQIFSSTVAPVPALSPARIIDISGELAQGPNADTLSSLCNWWMNTKEPSSDPLKLVQY